MNACARSVVVLQSCLSLSTHCVLCEMQSHSITPCALCCTTMRLAVPPISSALPRVMINIDTLTESLFTLCALCGHRVLYLSTATIENCGCTCTVALIFTIFTLDRRHSATKVAHFTSHRHAHALCAALRATHMLGLSHVVLRFALFRCISLALLGLCVGPPSLSVSATQRRCS
jgi:hypothetical protein